MRKLVFEFLQAAARVVVGQFGHGDGLLEDGLDFGRQHRLVLLRHVLLEGIDRILAVRLTLVDARLR